MLVDVADDGDVPQVPCQRAARDAVRGVDADQRHSRNVHDRLQVLVDELAIVAVHVGLVAEAQWRLPPGDIVIARYGYHPAHLPGVADEHCGALEFSRPRALTEIAGDDDDVELPLVDYLLDRLDLLGNCWPAEVQIRDVKNRHARRLRRDNGVRARRRDPRNGLQRWPSMPATGSSSDRSPPRQPI